MAPGTMLLEPIAIGAQATVCVKSSVAPGAALPDGAVLGPLSSTHELEAAAEGPADDKAFVHCCRPLMPEPHWMTVWFAGYPIVFLVKAFAAVPPILVLLGLVSTFGHELVARNSLTAVLECVWPSPVRKQLIAFCVAGVVHDGLAHV
jgi:hypothetical protein